MTKIDELAEQMYDYACSVRAAKKGEPFGDPRLVGCKFQDLFDEPKQFYTNLATFVLANGSSIFTSKKDEVNSDIHPIGLPKISSKIEA